MEYWKAKLVDFLRCDSSYLSTLIFHYPITPVLLWSRLRILTSLIDNFQIGS